MKKIFTIILFFTAAFIFSDEIATITYLEGWVDIKTGSGDISEAFIGDEVTAGNSVITDDDSYAELEESSGSTYNISPNTVFTVREMEIDGTKQNVLACTLGEIAFKFKRAGSLEPLIATNSTVAGVRGTNFRVYAGADGSSLIAVRDGLVEVESEGKTVSLSKDEAVEVRPGEGPGDKYSLKGKPLNFAAWNKEKEKEMLEDPQASLKGIEKRLKYYDEKIDELDAQFIIKKTLLDAETAKYQKMLDDKTIEKLDDEKKQLLRDLNNEAGILFLNKRYYTLTSLSMRRFIISKIYLLMKTKYIMKTDDPTYMDFMKIYNGMLKSFEDTVVPHLVEADI